MASSPFAHPVLAFSSLGPEQMPPGMRGRMMPPDPGPELLTLDVAPALVDGLREMMAPRGVMSAQTLLAPPQIAAQRAWGTLVLALTDQDWTQEAAAAWLDALERAHQSTPLVLIADTPSEQLAQLQVRLQPEVVLFRPTAAQLADAVRQTTTSQTLARQRRTSGQTVLAIGAHPDDVEIAIGGLLTRHVDAGDTVVVLVMTDGEEGGPRAVRLAEAEQAAATLGARLIFGHLRDTLVGERADAISVIEAAVAQWRPQVVYTHTLADKHQDHRTVHRATMVAARAVPNVYGYQAPSSDIQFHPQTFVDITDQFERKIQLVAAHRSQMKIRPYMTPEHLRSTAVYWGRFAGYRLVEPLEVYREVV